MTQAAQQLPGPLANRRTPRVRTPRRSRLVSRVASRVMFGLCIAFTCVIIALLVAITGYLISVGAKSLSVSFFTESPIAAGMEGYSGGMANGIGGTAILIALASAIGIPVGMGAGIFLSEYSANSSLGPPTRFIADVLTGVPSIVVGILGYELFVVPMGGFNGYAGGMALAFIMIPIVARTTEEMLRLVPHSYREASIALGASKARTIFKVVLPAATGSVITGVMLALARVAGETAPLLFTALGARLMTLDPSQPFPSLTVQIYQYASSPSPDEQRLARAGILVLISLIFLLNLVIRFFASRTQRVAT